MCINNENNKAYDKTMVKASDTVVDQFNHNRIIKGKEYELLNISNEDTNNERYLIIDELGEQLWLESSDFEELIKEK